MNTISTDRLTLRAPLEQDLPAIAALIGDFAVSRMLVRVPHPYTIEDAQAWFRRIGAPGAQDWQIFAIVLNGQAIGMVGFRGGSGEPSIGYWLGKAYWGRGYMSEACEAAVAWFFNNHDNDALHSGVFEDNPGSLRIQEKLGFEIVGSAMENCLATGEQRLELKTRLDRDVFRSRRPGIDAAATAREERS